VLPLSIIDGINLLRRRFVVSYDTNSVLVFGLYTEDRRMIRLGVEYGTGSFGKIPHTPLTQRFDELQPIFGDQSGDLNFRVHTEGDWCADEFYGAVVGLRIDVATLNDPAHLKALQDQARPYLEALRPLIPGATGDIQMHQIVQAG